MVSISGMAVSLKTDLRFPITGQQGHESRNIQQNLPHTGTFAITVYVMLFCEVFPYILCGNIRLSAEGV